MKKFFEELKRRNVIKATIAYLVVAWVLLQVASILLDTFNSPDWIKQAFTIILTVGLPVWIVISWVYDITPEGIEVTPADSEKQIIREITNKRLNTFIIAGLVIAVIVLAIRPSIFSSDSDKQYAIAILPFVDKSKEGDTQWVCDGITGDILTNLSKISRFIIISEQSSKQYRNSDKTIPEIAKELGVTHILEGDVTVHENKIKINTQLINAKDEHVWSENYSDNFDDVFRIREIITKQIAQQLKITLSPEEEKQIAYNPTDSLEAFKLYQKGRDLADERTQKGLESSIEYYKRAIEIDPNYSEAYAEIANSYYIMGSDNFIKLTEGIKKANNYIEKSFKIDSNTVRAYTVKGLIEHGIGISEKAKEYFEKAIELNPNDATAYHHLSQSVYRLNGDKKNQLITINKAQQLDPLSIIINGHKIRALLRYDEIQEAEEHFNKISFIFNDKTKKRYKSLLIDKKCELIVLQKKDWTEAIKLYQNEIEKDSTNSILFRKLGEAYSFILKDNKSFIKYSEKAYQMDSISSVNASQYYRALVENKNFIGAKNLLDNINFNNLFDDRGKLFNLFLYYHFQENYENAQEVLNDSLLSIYYYAKSVNLSYLGKVKEVYQILKDQKVNSQNKANVFAILKEKDSMYHYLNQLKINDIKYVNMSIDFNPYRKEERFKALLRKHYLPLTQWNE